jgi:transposase-like protein
MKRSRHTEEQIIDILKEQAAGPSVAELCRKRGMSDATYYNWKSKYRLAGPGAVFRLRFANAGGLTFGR